MANYFYHKTLRGVRNLRKSCKYGTNKIIFLVEIIHLEKLTVGTAKADRQTVNDNPGHILEGKSVNL